MNSIIIFQGQKSNGCTNLLALLSFIIEHKIKKATVKAIKPKAYFADRSAVCFESDFYF